MATPDNLRYVEGELNYLVPMPERPRYYAYDAGPEAPTNMAHEAHTVRIHDLRPIQSEVALDRAGLCAGRAAHRGAGLLGRGRGAPGLLSRRLSASSPK